MRFTVKAKTVDSANKAISTPIRVYVKKSNGTDQLLFEKTSTSRGTLSKQVTISGVSHIPYVFLKRKSGRSWVSVSANPVSVSSNTIDFGTVKIGATVFTPIATESFRASTVTLDHIIASPTYKARLTEITKLNTEKTSLISEKKSLTTELGKLNTTLAGVRKSLSDTEEEVTALNREKLTLSDKNKALTTKLNGFEGRVRTAERETGRLNTLLGEKLASIADLKEQLALRTPRETETSKVFSNVGSQIDAADKKLSEMKSRFRLKSVNLELKHLPGQDGSKVMLADSLYYKEGGDPGRLSVLNLDFHADDSAPAPRKTEKIKMPDLEGYTQRQVDRLLSNMGLKFQWRYESLRDSRIQKAKHGTVLSQTPPVNAEIDKDSKIFVTIGQRSK